MLLSQSMGNYNIFQTLCPVAICQSYMDFYPSFAVIMQQVSYCSGKNTLFSPEYPGQKHLLQSRKPPMDRPGGRSLRQFRTEQKRGALAARLSDCQKVELQFEAEPSDSICRGDYQSPAGRNLPFRRTFRRIRNILSRGRSMSAPTFTPSGAR